MSDSSEFEIGFDGVLKVHQGFSNFGVDHSTIGVEIEQSTIKDHHQNLKEMQKFEVGTEVQKETSEIHITNVDTGTFKLVFQNPKTSKKVMTASMTINGDEAESVYRDNIRKAINAYYDGSNIDAAAKVWNDIEVKRLDANGNTVAMAKQVKVVITIVSRKQFTSISTNTIQVVKGTTQATFDVKTQSVRSGAPIAGSYRIKCINKEKAASYSKPIESCSKDYTIHKAIHESCDGLRDKI